jgi:hypothetical protein
MYKVRFLALILFCSAIAVAQGNQKLGRVTVKVVDENEGAISDTRITLTGKDGKQISGLTDGDGQLELEVPEGNYSVATDHVHRWWKKFSLQQFAVSGRSAKELRIVLKFNPEGTAGGLLVEADPIPKVKQASTSVLTGTVYDARGAVIPRIKIIAVNAEGKRFEAVTNDDGVYLLNLPYNEYPGTGTFKGAQYDLIVESQKGFPKSETRGFVFVPAYSGKMYFDIALGVPPPIWHISSEQISK